MCDYNNVKAVMKTIKNHHYYECGMVKFHQKDRIHGLERGFAENPIYLFLRVS